MGTPLSLRQAQKLRPPIMDLDFKGLGTLRVARLNVKEKLDVLELLDQIQRDEDGKDIDLEHNVKLFVSIVSMLLRGPDGEPEFDTPEGHEWVSRLEDLHFNRLVRIALAQTGYGELKPGDVPDYNTDDLPTEGQEEPESDLELAKNV